MLHGAVVEAFVKHHLEQGSPPRSLRLLDESDLRHYFETTDKAVANRVSFKRLVKFLLDSGRIDWDSAKDMEELLKNQKA